jgi:hypothetical protein
MKVKSLIASAALALSLATIGSARTWDFSVASTVKAGNIMLPAGNYTVKVDNNQALFTSDNGKKFTVPVKIQTAAKKFDNTEVRTAKQGDTNVIQVIDLSGTTEELQFGE